MAGMYNHVPEDLVFAILVKLPTKPLLRLRCLSKHWNHTISDHFMKSRSRRMILLPFKPLQVMDTATHSVSELPFPNFMNPGSEGHLIIGGTYNGIVLLVLKDMILYNPLTGAYKTVPNPPPSKSSTSTSYGFCYGTSLEDLKIVRLNDMKLNVEQDSRWCDVFSLKKGSWSTTSRTLVRAFNIIDSAGTFANGFLYWRAVRGNMHFIVALDVKEMVLSEIRFPPSLFGTLGGRLYLFRYTRTKFELWVENEHGMEKPWSKVLMTTNTLRGYNTPMSIMDAGKIVMLRAGRRKPMQIIIYDMLKDSQEIYEVKARNLISRIWRLQAMEYVESLISPSHLCSNLI